MWCGVERASDGSKIPSLPVWAKALREEWGRSCCRYEVLGTWLAGARGAFTNQHGHMAHTQTEKLHRADKK